MELKQLSQLKLEIQVKAKNGIDFVMAGSILWFGIFIIWNLDYTSYSKSIFTFMVSAILLPLAFGLSKVFKTNWKIKDNPLQSLGLWLNFAQLIYFPFLVFILIKQPDFFIMSYAIITGAHLFPYAWFYDEIGYAVVAISIAVGALLLALNISPDKMWIIPLCTSIMLFGLAGKLYLSTRKLNLEKLERS